MSLFYVVVCILFFIKEDSSSIGVLNLKSSDIKVYFNIIVFLCNSSVFYLINLKILFGDVFFGFIRLPKEFMYNKAEETPEYYWGTVSNIPGGNAHLSLGLIKG